MKNDTTSNKTGDIKKFYPFITGEERLAIWENARKILGHRADDMLKELEKMREEWDRPLPPLGKKDKA